MAYPWREKSGGHFTALLGLMILLLSPIIGVSQSTEELSEKLSANLKVLSERRPTNLVYIQTSKGIYEKGEDLWFKTYELNAQFLEPSHLSKTLYLQLVSEKEELVVWQEKYEIVNGFAEGHVYLIDSLSAGDYFLIASTPYSIPQANSNFSATRKIKIVDNIRSFRSKQNNEVDTSKLKDFMIFPEGGHLVDGLPSRVAFKAVDELGQPVEVKGMLYQNNQPLLEIKSVHAGMGSFDLIPKAGSKYHIKLEGELEENIFSLPKMLSEGITMKLSEKNQDKLVFHIARTDQLLNEQLYFRLQMRGVTYGIATVKPGTNRLVLPLKSFPKGIAECTIFNERYEALAERLIFINSEKKLHISASFDNENEFQEFATREKVSLKLKVKDKDGNPVIGNLGVSIYEKQFEHKEDPKNIFTHFYLSTQIRGKIYDPAYYFNEDNPNRLQSLDLLLLTQGWRRYVWSEDNLAELVAEPSIVIDNGVKGIARSRKKSRKGANLYPTIMTYTPDTNGPSNVIESDASGNFTLNPSDLKIGQGAYTYLKYFAPNNTKYDLILTDTYSMIDSLRGLSKISYPEANREPESLIEFTMNSSIGTVRLDEVMVTAKSRTIVRDKYLGKLDSLAKLEIVNDYVCFENILNCQEHPTHPKNIKPVEGGIYMEMLVWTEDGFVPGTDKSNGFINPELPPYRYPVLTDEYLLERYNIVRTKGYYGHKEFYQPNHEELYDPAPDYRNTLLWVPMVITDENGEAEISFFCSDLNTKFICEIEGVSSTGLIGAQELEFRVLK